MLDIHQLRCFCEAVESGSFSLAARRLHVSQPTISAQIRRLEAELNVQALRRSGRRGTQLTEEGEVVYHYALEILRNARDLHVALDRLRSGTTGDVMVGATFSAHIYILPTILAKFARHSPDLQVHLHSGDVADVLERVQRGVVDMGVVWGPVDTSRFESEHLMDEEFVLVAPESHPLARSETVMANEVTDVPFIMNDNGSSTQRFVDHAFASLGVELRRTIHIGMPAAVKEAILAGLGIGVILGRAVAREIAEGRLVRLPVEGLKLTRPLLLVWKKDSELSCGSRKWADFVKAELLRSLAN